MTLPNLPTIPADKLGHFFYGSLICSGMMCLTHIVWLSLGVCAAVAFLKEFFDWLANCKAERQGLPPPHGVELMDAVATIGGGVVVVLPWIISGYSA
jgi:hypothetical protein